MLRREPCHVHTVGVRPGNEETAGGRGTGGTQRPEGVQALSAPSAAPSPNGDPPNGPTRNQKTNKASFLFDFKMPATKEEATG